MMYNTVNWIKMVVWLKGVQLEINQYHLHWGLMKYHVSWFPLRRCVWKVPFQGITHGGFFIYIKLGILSLCTEPWHGTRSISISWDFCLYWKTIWWIDYVYRYWLWIHTHVLTTFNLTWNCSLILTHARRSDQYCRA